MKWIKRISLAMLAICLMFSCEKYEDYIFDHIPTVYFGAQRPLRTVVSRDADMEFKLGVVLAGVRENHDEEWVRYRLEPELLEDTAIVGDNQFTMMPEAYYTLSNEDKFIVHPGDVIGEVTVTLDHDLFTADPDALANTYAFPLRIVETSAERILDGEDDTPEQDYTIVVVKYISQHSGYYYRRGVQYEMAPDGSYADTLAFTNPSLNKSDVWYLETLSASKVETKTTSDIEAGSPRNFLELHIDENHAVSIFPAEENVTMTDEWTSFDTENNIFYFDYKFEKEGISYHVLDTLIQRQDPELDLRFEQW